jgi:predicted MFS family arabinose efflux permease
VVVLELIAVSVLVPESRNPHPARLDVVGALTSSLGLAGVTYGFIEAGEKGWSNAGALAVMAAGVVVLAAFVSWQRRFARRPQGQPLIDLGLFRSASFTWGTILATLMNFALFGPLFAMPQYFQAVKGTDALGTGLRLLPLIGGLVIGARVGGSLVPRAGAKVVVAIGFVLLAAGLVAGANTASGSGYALAATWLTIDGLGVGFAMPTALDAAIGALSAARSGGVGSHPGGAPGRQRHRRRGPRHRAELVLPGHLDVTGLPAQAAGAVRESISAGVAVAPARLHVPARPRRFVVRPRHGRRGSTPGSQWSASS